MSSEKHLEGDTGELSESEARSTIVLPEPRSTTLDRLAGHCQGDLSAITKRLKELADQKCVYVLILEAKLGSGLYGTPKWDRNWAPIKCHKCSHYIAYPDYLLPSTATYPSPHSLPSPSLPPLPPLPAVFYHYLQPPIATSPHHYLQPSTITCSLPPLPAAVHHYLQPPTATCSLPSLPTPSRQYSLPPTVTWRLSPLSAASRDYLIPSTTASLRLSLMILHPLSERCLRSESRIITIYSRSE